MYLSRLRFDPRHPTALRKLGDVYAMHQYVYHAFPDGQPVNDEGRGILWRTELPGSGIPTVIVLSRVQPDWTRPQNDILIEPPESRSWEPRFTAGQRLAFRLRANPTKRIHEDAKKPGVIIEKGMRVALLKESEQLDWMIRRAAVSGFRVSDEDRFSRTGEEGDDTYDPSVCWFRIQARNRITCKRPGTAKTMTWDAIDYEGLLQVTDANAFQNALVSGIGSAKGFGFGLLSLAPVK